MAGIYVHVPFCHAKCAYCDFYSIADRRRTEAYVEAVGKEYKARQSELGDYSVDTLYFGGGTPSILRDEEFGRLTAFFPKTEETTMEVNPEDVSVPRAAIWGRLGVNRISMGVQSLVDAELRSVGRRHSAEDALRAIGAIRNGGIGNISCDLIYGLPGQTADSWEYSLRRLLDTGIGHLSAYSLTFEEGTLLTRKRDQGMIKEAPEELTEEMYVSLCRIAKEYGFEHYEISNFALPGLCSRHNSSYWTGSPYLGLGPGAHSLDKDGIRRFVPPSVKDYIKDPESAATIDEETAADRVNDKIMVSLRTAKGLNLDDFHAQDRRLILKNCEEHLRLGNLQQLGTYLYIPESRWLISDMIIGDLFI